MMARIEHQIRKALEHLNRCTTADKGELSAEGIGDKTIARLLDSGLVTLSHSPTGLELYAITEAGKKNSAETPPASQAKPKLTTLPARVKTLPQRLK